MVTALMREASRSPADAEKLERLLCRHVDAATYRKLRDSISSGAGGADGLVAGGHQMNGGGAARKSVDGRRELRERTQAAAAPVADASGLDALEGPRLHSPPPTWSIYESVKKHAHTAHEHAQDMRNMLSHHTLCNLWSQL